VTGLEKAGTAFLVYLVFVLLGQIFL